jgi:TRAP-type C4-dicarboxylate transport system substrate-binding protein
MVFMNVKTWDALPAAVQKAIMDLAPEHSAWTGKYVDDHGKEALEWSAKTHAFALTELDAAQKKALREMARPVIDQWIATAAAKGIEAGTLLEEVLRAKEKAEQ